MLNKYQNSIYLEEYLNLNLNHGRRLAQIGAVEVKSGRTRSSSKSRSKSRPKKVV